MVKRKKRRLKKGPIIILILLLCGGGYFLYNIFKNDEVENIEENNLVVQKEIVDIVSVDSDIRDIAVMINNHPKARPYHSGLNESYLIYEILVEGGYTRYMALYNDKNTERIGSVRSSRHYFLDYAIENDAIYVHWGWSPQAESDISEFGINNINGLQYENSYFFRDKSLNVDLSVIEGNIVANNVFIPYSGVVKTSYVYNPETMLYERYVNDVEHKDKDDSEEVNLNENGAEDEQDNKSPQDQTTPQSDSDSVDTKENKVSENVIEEKDGKESTAPNKSEKTDEMKGAEIA